MQNWGGSSGIKDGGIGAEGPARFARREMRDVAWCRSGVTVTSGGKHAGGGVVRINLCPTIAVIGSSLFDFSAPVEDAVLAESCVNTVAVSDIKKQLSMNAFGTRGRVHVRDDRWIETVAGDRCCEGRLAPSWARWLDHLAVGCLRHHLQQTRGDGHCEGCCED